MINLETECIELPGREPTKIKEYKVWWKGPLGLVMGIPEVKKQAGLLGIEPENIIFHFNPTPIAVGEDGSYETLR